MSTSSTMFGVQIECIASAGRQIEHERTRESPTRRLSAQLKRAHGAPGGGVDRGPRQRLLTMGCFEGNVMNRLFTHRNIAQNTKEQQMLLLQTPAGTRANQLCVKLVSQHQRVPRKWSFHRCYAVQPGKTLEMRRGLHSRGSRYQFVERLRSREQHVRRRSILR